MVDEKTKQLLDICDIKYDVVAVMLKKSSNGNITDDEIKKFNNYLNVIVKETRSSNNLNNRISSLYEVVKKYYQDYTKINSIITDNKQPTNK